MKKLLYILVIGVGLTSCTKEEFEIETNYLIKAAEGKVFTYDENEIAPPEPEPIKTFNLYGEYE